MKKFYILLVISALFLITCKKLPELKIYNLEISEESVTTTTSNATISAKYSFPTEIYEIKVLVNTTNNMDNASFTVATIENNLLSATIDNLLPSTSYYYCFRYSNGINMVDTDVKSFTTLNVTIPVLMTHEATEITLTTACCGGNVTSDGGATVLDRGVCWSTSQNPTINASIVSSGDGMGEFVCNLTGLSANTTYYVRAYAKNDAGIAYGNQTSFNTLANPVLPTVTTNDMTNITQTTADGGGNVTSDGGADITERGICWSISHNPTISNNHTSNGTGTGSYSVNIDGLTANTTYYVRAYAKNSVGTAYGNEVSFKTSATPTVPVVTTANITNITQTSATGGGNVTSTGGSNVSQRGICWSTSQNPTTNNNHVTSGVGVGNFTCNMTGLTSNTTYYVRAYAINEVGTAYGDQKSFITGSNVINPTVTTNNVTNVTTSSATCGGNVTSAGNGTVTARGVCWSTSSNPTISGSHTTNGSGTGSFTSSITGLSANTTYYVRAYATNEAGTAYGSQKTFTTNTNITQPTVTTNNVTDITSTSATCGGNVTSAGNGTVTARGVCWSTSSNPTITGSHTTNGSGTGSFTSSITGLNANTTYYVRAYATNEAGTAYGSQKVFTTSSGITAPTGAINGLFSVSATQQVWFSKGNIQYKSSTNTWKFADNQYDYIGSANSNISSTYNGWIDLFGWGTSGYNHGAICYEPWSTSSNTSDYYAYGNSNLNLNDQNGQADWGYNAITNGGNSINQWRTLTKDEWEYLLTIRITGSGIRYVKAQVNGANGLIILPDNWINSTYTLNSPNSPDANYTNNVISATNWITLESGGAVFLPAAGERYGTTGVMLLNSNGYYLSATYYNNDRVYNLSFNYGGVTPNDYGTLRYSGHSVRLVQDY